jgi:hypothetical protein
MDERTQREQSGRFMGQLWDDEQIVTVANDLKETT